MGLWAEPRPGIIWQLLLNPLASRDQALGNQLGSHEARIKTAPALRRARGGLRDTPFLPRATGVPSWEGRQRLANMAQPLPALSRGVCGRGRRFRRRRGWAGRPECSSGPGRPAHYSSRVTAVSVLRKRRVSFMGTLAQGPWTRGKGHLSKRHYCGRARAWSWGAS